MSNRPLSHNLSVYLDLLRLTAASAVFLDHARNLIFPYATHNFLFQHGSNAVAVFFVLSGFVISHATSTKEQDLRSYFVARSSRIYSVALLALLATIICDRIGLSYNPGAYADLKFYHPETITAALRYVTFSNELWFSHVVFGTNEPYWSLGFEVWYYIWFAAFFFLSGKVRVFAILIWFVICGPKIALYLPLWLVGVLTHRHVTAAHTPLPKALAMAGVFTSVVLYLLVFKVLSPVTVVMFGMFNLPMLEVVSFVSFMLIGFSVYINLLCFNALVGDRPFWPRAVERCIKWLAGATFTLYLVHQPLLTMIFALFPDTAKHLLLGVLACLAAALAVLALAELGERQKRLFSRGIDSLVNYFIKNLQRRPGKI